MEDAFGRKLEIGDKVYHTSIINGSTVKIVETEVTGFHIKVVLLGDKDGTNDLAPPHRLIKIRYDGI